MKVQDLQKCMSKINDQSWCKSKIDKIFSHFWQKSKIYSQQSSEY